MVVQIAKHIVGPQEIAVTTRSSANFEVLIYHGAADVVEYVALNHLKNDLGRCTTSAKLTRSLILRYCRRPRDLRLKELSNLSFRGKPYLPLGV